MIWLMIPKPGFRWPGTGIMGFDKFGTNESFVNAPALMAQLM